MSPAQVSPMAIRDVAALEPLVRARMLLQGKLDVEAYLEEIGKDVLEDLDEHLKESLESEEAVRAYARIIAGSGRSSVTPVGNTEARVDLTRPSGRDLDILRELLAAGVGPDASRGFWTRTVRRLRSVRLTTRSIGRLLDALLPDGGQRGQHERRTTEST